MKLLYIAIMFAIFMALNYLRGDMTGAIIFFVVTIITIILVTFYSFVYPDRWKMPLFIIDGNDLIVEYIGRDMTERWLIERWEKVKWRNKIHIRIDADRKSKLRYLKEINHQRYELIFDGIKPKSIYIDLDRLSRNDRNILRNFIFSNYGDKLISNKISTTDR